MFLSTASRYEPAIDNGARLFISNSGSERRRGLRLAQYRPVKVYEPMTCRFIAGHTEDVSTTGLRISLPRSSLIRPGCFLNVHVGVSSGGQPLANRRDMMSARVVWVDPASDPAGRSISAGIEFTASIDAQLDAA